MSGICGIINFDGSPVNPSTLKEMAAAAAYRGPDGITYWNENNAGLAHLSLHSTPESLQEIQPLVNRSKDLVLVADARVDNREELIRTLTAKGFLHQNKISDAEVILAAYECWGKDCPKEIIGDFAFMIWDKARQRLFAARDAVGVRQLHYHRTNRTILLATSLGSIMAAIPSTPPLNTPLLKNVCRGNFDLWVNETVYQAVFRLPPAHVLLADSNDTRLYRYWFLGDIDFPTYKRERDYSDHFLDLFSQAVNAQTRSSGHVGVMGGAGLDSASIICTHDHIQWVQNTTTPIYVYSAIFDQADEADEREYTQITLDHCTHAISRMINCDDCWALSELPEDQGYPYDDLDMSNCDRSMLLKLMSAASNDKCRVILGGHWGDQVTGQPAYGNPHCIRDVPFSKLSGELPIFIQKYHYPTWHFFLRAIMPALIPANLYSELTRKRRNIHVSKSIQTAAQDYLHPPRFRFASALQIYRSVSSGIVSARLAAYDRISAHTGVEWRFPFLDRRLIDFMLNVPGHMVFRGGVNRYTHRQAMQGVLPVEIRLRRSKARFNQLYEKGVQEKGAGRIKELSTDAEVVSSSLVEESIWLDSFKKGYSQNMLWMLCVEIWLRQIKNGGFTA